MFRLQGAIIRPLYKNRSLSGFGVRLGSQLFTLLGYCCIQYSDLVKNEINPLKPELNPICYLLALLGARHFLHVSRIRVKLLTFRLLMS
jgi:transposase